jgi:hypothetical protein
MLKTFNVNAQVINSPINDIKGTYISYKWVDLPVTESFDPDSFKGKKMIIKQNSLILFLDTISNVEYNFNKQDQIDFFRAFRHFDYRRIGIKEDNVLIMRVACPQYKPSPQIDIVVTKDFLITEFRGYFYFFRKVSN